MTEPSIKTNLHWLLLRASLQAKQQLMKISEEYDLTIMQIYTLLFLEPENEMPMHTISGLLCCDPSNVTAIVDRLEVGLYIERRENPTDRRVKVIGLTDAGVMLRNELLERIEKKNVPDMSQLTVDEYQTLEQILLKIVSTT